MKILINILTIAWAPNREGKIGHLLALAPLWIKNIKNM